MNSIQTDAFQNQNHRGDKGRGEIWPGTLEKPDFEHCVNEVVGVHIV